LTYTIEQFILDLYDPLKKANLAYWSIHHFYMKSPKQEIQNSMQDYVSEVGELKFIQ